MMTKKLFISGGAVVFTLASVMTAQAAVFTASCSGVPTGTLVAWTATSTGGIAPVAYLWSNGSTSTVQNLTHTPGVYSFGLTATDASSTVATTTCSATVTATTTPPVATTTPPVATTTVPLFRQANLNIEDDGHFKGKGMIIQTVGTDSFTAKVFGVTFTVNMTATPGLTVGNYVDVSGFIDQASGVVTAKSVREFPSSKVVTSKVKELKERSKEKKQEERSEKKIEKIETRTEQKIQKIEQKAEQQIQKIEKRSESKKSEGHRSND